MTATVESLTVSLNDAASAAANAVAASLAKVADAADRAAASTTTTDAVITRSTRSWQNWASSGVDPAATSAKRIEQAQKAAQAATDALNQALANGTISAAQFVKGQADIAAVLAQRAAAAQAAQDKQDKLRASTDAAAVSTTGLADAYARLQAGMAQGQSIANAFAGLQAPDAGSFAARAADIAAYGDQLDRLRARYNPLFAASQQYATELDGIAEAEKVGAISAVEAAAARDRVTAAFAAASAPLKNVATWQDSVRASAEALSSAYQQLQVDMAKGQSIANSFAGIQMPDAGLTAERAADVAAYGEALDLVRAKFNPVFAASKQYEGALDEIGAAEKVGAISAAEAAAARGRATEAFAAANAPMNALAASSSAASKASSDLGDVTKASSQALRSFSIQAIQAASGLATGQPVFQVAIQQGHQVFDSMLAGGAGFSALGTAAKAAFAAIGGWSAVITGGIVVSLVAAAASAAATAERMEDLRQSLRATRDDYAAWADGVDAIAKRIAATSVATTADARAAAAAIANSASFFGGNSDWERLVRDAADMARVFGITVPEAATRLVQALKDPAAAAKQLAEEGFGGISQAAARQIELVQRSGDVMSAQAAITKVYEDRLKGAADAGTPLQKAIHGLEEALTGAGQGGRSFLDVIGAPLVDAAAAGVDALKGLLTATNDLQKAWSNKDASASDWISAGLGLLDPNFKRMYDQYRAGQPSVPSSSNLATLPTDEQSAIQNAAGITGLDPNFLAAVRAIEGVRNADGTWQTSSAGAVGPMQVTPDTFTDMQRLHAVTGSINDLNSNMLAGAYRLSDMVQQYGLQMGLAAYNWGPGKVDKALASGGSLPDSVQAYIRNVQSAYSGNGFQNGAIPLAGINVTADRDLPVPPVPPTFGANQRMMNDAFAAGGGTTYTTQQDLAASIQLQQSAQKVAQERIAALQNAGIGPDDQAMKEATDSYNRAGAALVDLRGHQNDARSAIDLYVRSLKDQLPAANAVYEGDQRIAEVNQRLNEIDRSAPGTVTADKRAEAVNAALELQSAAYRKVVSDTDDAITAQDKVTAAYGQGYGAVAQVTAETQALSIANKLYPRDSEAARAAAAKLTDEYLRQAQGARNVQIAAATLNNKDQVDYLNVETASLGMADDARTAYLAHFKAQQELTKAQIPLESDLAKAYLTSVDAVSAATAAYQHQKAALDEVGSFFTSTFDTISNAITSAYAQGNLAALRFKDIAHSVVSAVLSEFIKLAAIDPLKDLVTGSSSPNLLSVLGLLGGNATTVMNPIVAPGTALGNLGTVSAFDAPGIAPDSAGNSVSGGSASSSSGSLLNSLGTVGTLAKGLDWLSGGKLLSGVKDYVFNAVGYSPGESIGAYVSSLIGEQTAGAAAGAAGSAAATEVASGVAGAASDVGSLGATAVSGVSSANASVGVIGNAAGQIADALPYIGAAISVVTDLVQGNFRGAGLVAGGALVGAAIGSAIGSPGIGTAVGAAVGALVDAILPSHPLHPFQDTEVDIQGGRIVAGKTVSQIEDTSGAVQQVQQYSDALGKFMDTVGIRLTNADGLLGHIGDNIKGLPQVTSIDQLFPQLRFDTADRTDTSNWGVAKDALNGMQFQDENALVAELSKIGGFADAMDAVGIHLGDVAADLTNIKIASVDQGDGSNQLRVALAHDLPGQNFANTDALDAEINKVNQFVNGTLPGLLSPLEQTSSSITERADKIDAQYSDARLQAAAYGLDMGQALTDAENTALAIVRKQGVEQINASWQSLNDQSVASMQGTQVSWVKTFHDFDVQAQQGLEAFSKEWTDTYGDAVTTNTAYLQAMADAEASYGAQRLALVQQVLIQEMQAFETWASASDSVKERLLKDQGNDRDAALLAFDDQARADITALQSAYLTYFGANYQATAEYQSDLTSLETAQQIERLGIVTKYGTMMTDAQVQAYTQAQGQVSSLFTSLSDYVLKLQTGSDSALSPTAQYDLASSQFNAVYGAAAAGDASSASKLTSYADTFLSASRDVNGSGAAYATDESRVLDAIQSLVSGTSAEALTQSFITQDSQQTRDTIAQGSANVVDAVNAMRREIQGLRTQLAQAS